MKHLVVTTINRPTPAVVSLAEGAARSGWRFVLVGDRKSPPDFHVPGTDYLDVQEQLRRGFRFAEAAPFGHYARKNVGYLVAIRNRAEAIVETDDDNLPIDGFWDERSASISAPILRDRRWVNVYRYFSDAMIWPRGLPLDEVLGSVPPLDGAPLEAPFCPVQQGLAQENPDVDAIYRLTMPLPIGFRSRDPVVLMGALCPFNSQNTWWWPEAYPLMYLPFHCSFRMTDIWRSFVVQTILHRNGWGLSFHQATVVQDRNDHDLMKDFSDEVIGYLNNRAVMDRLADLPLGGKPDSLFDDMRRCYEEFIRLELIGAAERPLLDAWRSDVEAIGPA
jgi:hypothetical protein